MTAGRQAKYVRFLFIGEGSLDDHLVTHLRRCCILAGADEAEDVTVPFGRLGDSIGHTVTEKLAFALKVEPHVNLIFVHRDADSPDPEPRYREISEAIVSVDATQPYIAVVPVQETEAWLLLEESEIRRVAENPTGSIALNTPSPSTVEGIASPKESLAEMILEASELSGRRYRKMKTKVHQKCILIIDALDPEGPVCKVPSWQRMFSDLRDAIEAVGISTIP